jgi:heme-degrading monooxygenase HmoA
MITLHIYLQVTPVREAELERLYRDEYAPAISRQRGFRSAALLRTYDKARANAIDARRDWTHEIDIVFDTEEDRQTWATSPEHARVWPRVESVCERITWQGFDILE